MLQINRSTTLIGISTINGKQVASFSTSISADQTYSNVTMTITDPVAYDVNKSDVRKDRDSFQDKADAMQDEIDKEAATENAASQDTTAPKPANEE